MALEPAMNVMSLSTLEKKNVQYLASTKFLQNDQRVLNCFSGLL